MEACDRRVAEACVAAEMDVAESFGQRVDLTARLREILAAYPEGTTFLRELLQNAVRSVALLTRLPAFRG